jgi:hypothetical protein
VTPVLRPRLRLTGGGTPHRTRPNHQGETVTTETTPAPGSLITEPRMADTNYGIHMAPLGEDGDDILALGHHGKRKALAAFNRYARTVIGLPNIADDFQARAQDWFDAIEQRWAVFTVPDPEEGQDPDWAGSMRFADLMAEVAVEESVLRRALVLKPDVNMKLAHPLWADPAEAEALKLRLDDQHRQKIRLADRVIVVGDYAGDSTRGEIAYARELGKPIRFTHPALEAEFATTTP